VAAAASLFAAMWHTPLIFELAHEVADRNFTRQSKSRQVLSELCATLSSSNLLVSAKSNCKVVTVVTIVVVVEVAGSVLPTQVPLKADESAWEWNSKPLVFR
jgi:hypothetical protein